MAKCCCNRKRCSIILVVSGIVLTVSMVVCVVIGVFNELIKKEIDKEVQLKPGTETFKNWQSPSSAVYMQYFMFNITNPGDVASGGKPYLQQVGPYSYREVRHNVPVNYSDETVVYLSQKAYVFDAATSCAGCNASVDRFFTINIPLLKLAQVLVQKFHSLPIPYLWQELFFDVILVEEQAIEVRSAQELLWGYRDPLLSAVKDFEDIIKKFVKKNVSLPAINPVIQLQHNNSNTSSEIYTGVGDIDKLGQYASWNHLRKLTWWGTKWANMINGTDGSMFHPSVSKTDKLYCFVSDVCRSLFLTFDSTITVKGIKLYRFIAPEKLFEYTPDAKAGFCVANNHTCVPKGLLDISVCQPMGVPIVVSLPHFLFANESVQNAVGGLHPRKEDHATFISVEPNTGITMKADKRIQINVAVKKVPQIKKLSKLRNVFLPVMFVNESACIDQHDADKFKKNVYLPMKIVYIGKYVLIGVGSLLLIIGLLLLGLSRKRSVFIPPEPTIQVNSADGADEKTRLLNRAM